MSHGNFQLFYRKKVSEDMTLLDINATKKMTMMKHLVLNEIFYASPLFPFTSVVDSVSHAI